MAKVTFIENSNTEHSVEAEPGRSLMQIAVDNMVPGIYGECGGACSCATCHVYVAPEWLARLPAKSSDEAFMLDGAFEPNEHSRLCCQVKMREELDGMVLRIPVSQG